MGLFSSLDRDKNYILVTHEGLSRTLVCTVLSMPPYRRHLFKIILSANYLADNMFCLEFSNSHVRYLYIQF
ncbi:MAG: hypothetical protein CVV46_15440 [Spirochaetae bacterium HGW-Spirochaetae-2]|nr:MAG: hypothetical protein CVV46_15440 [Spirochaetae bacterium HGW-Spirochaetae-2]